WRQCSSDGGRSSTTARSPSVSSPPQPEDVNSGPSPVRRSNASSTACLIGRSAPGGRPSPPRSAPILQNQIRSIGLSPLLTGGVRAGTAAGLGYHFPPQGHDSDAHQQERRQDD